MLAMALNPFGVRSLVGLMKLPAALLTRPCSGPLSSQMRWTIASTAAASRMSTACVRTFPPRDFAVSSSTPPRRPQIHSSAPSSRYLAAISLPRPVPPPVMRMRLPLSSPSLNMRAPWGGSGHFKSFRRVGSHTVTERPVLFRDLDQVDPPVFAPQRDRGVEVVGDAPVERALLFQRAAAGERDLDNHQVARARDAEVHRVVHQVARLVLGDELEAIERRHVDGLDQRAVDGLAHLAPVGLGLALNERNADERHGARASRFWHGRTGRRSERSASRTSPRSARGAPWLAGPGDRQSRFS